MEAKMDSQELKRQILQDAEKSTTYNKIASNLKNNPAVEGELLEQGNALDSLVKQRGWTYVEEWMLRNMNVVGLIMSSTNNAEAKFRAKAYMELMQWINATIKARNAILSKDKENDNG